MRAVRAHRLHELRTRVPKVRVGEVSHVTREPRRVDVDEVPDGRASGAPAENVRRGVVPRKDGRDRWETASHDFEVGHQLRLVDDARARNGSVEGDPLPELLDA